LGLAWPPDARLKTLGSGSYVRPKSLESDGPWQIQDTITSIGVAQLGYIGLAYVIGNSLILKILNVKGCDVLTAFLKF